MGKQAVLLLAHGTPETVDQIPEYLRNVVSGRPIPQAVVEEIQHRYSLIGRSPLTEITMEQARLAGEELAAGGDAVPVYVGMRNWRPYIPDVVRQMRADGVEEAAVICMAPQNSRTSVGLYRRAVEAEAAGLRIDFTPGWARHPLLAQAFAERLRPVLSKLSAEVGAPVPVLFTAHSVPTRTVEPAANADAGPRLWPVAVSIRTRKKQDTQRNWWLRRCRRFRAGGLRSRVRARAAGRGLGLRWRARWIQLRRKA